MFEYRGFGEAATTAAATEFDFVAACGGLPITTEKERAQLLFEGNPTPSEM